MVVGALVAVQSDGVAWQLDDLDEVRGKTRYWFSSLSNLLHIHTITKTLVWCIREQRMRMENTSDLVWAGIGHRPVVLGFVD